MDNLTKARALFREISGKKRLGVFTDRNKTLYHEGRIITPTEIAQLSKQFERTITIKVKII